MTDRKKVTNIQKLLKPILSFAFDTDWFQTHCLFSVKSMSQTCNFVVIVVIVSVCCQSVVILDLVCHICTFLLKKLSRVLCAMPDKWV